jgi:membrane-associated phospholipid phosphatase
VARRLPRTRARVRGFDALVDAGFDHLRGRPGADHLFYAASELGDFSLIWLILGTARALRSEADERAALRLGAALAAESWLVNWGVKSLFRRSRPPWKGSRPRRLRRPLTSSFPSGHATSSFVSAVLLSDDDPLWPLYWGVAGVVAGSRVYVRIHHASDVVAGAALGVAMGLAVRRLAPLPGAPGQTMEPVGAAPGEAEGAS